MSTLSKMRDEMILGMKLEGIKTNYYNNNFNKYKFMFIGINFFVKTYSD